MLMSPTPSGDGKPRGMQTITFEQFKTFGSLPPHPTSHSSNASAPHPLSKSLPRSLSRHMTDEDESWDDVEVPDCGFAFEDEEDNDFDLGDDFEEPSPAFGAQIAKVDQEHLNTGLQKFELTLPNFIRQPHASQQIDTCPSATSSNFIDGSSAKSGMSRNSSRSEFPNDDNDDDDQILFGIGKDSNLRLGIPNSISILSLPETTLVASSLLTRSVSQPHITTSQKTPIQPQKIFISYLTPKLEPLTGDPDLTMESFDDDFDLPQNFQLPTVILSPITRSKSFDFDSSFDDQNFFDPDSSMTSSIVPGFISRRCIASPTPSSTCSMLLSESDDEVYDDIEFPESMDQLMLKPVTVDLEQEVIEIDHVEQGFNQYKDKEDISDGLLFPDDMNLVGRLQKHRSSSPVASQSPSTPTRRPQQATTITTTNSSNHRNQPFVADSELLRSSSPSKIPRYIHSLKLNSRVLTKPKNQLDSYTGTELDLMDDLNVSPDLEKKYTKPPKQPTSPQKLRPVWNSNTPTRLQQQQQEQRGSPMYTRYGQIGSQSPASNVSPRRIEELRTFPRSSSSSSPSSLGSVSILTPKKRSTVKRVPRKQPTLIRNLSVTTLPKTINGMVWNPALRRWDGNEDILTLFSPHLPSTFRETSNIDKNDANVMSGSAKKPALITQKSLTGLAMVGGGVKGEMVFDPVLMRWIGNEEELDVFDDDEFGMNTNISTLNDPTNYPSEFVIPQSLKNSFKVSEAAHRTFMSRWYLRGVNDPRVAAREASRNWLFDVRQILMGTVERRFV